MHVFFYDPILVDSKFSALLAKIETKITDLGLGGKIIRLNLLNNLEKAVTDEAKLGQTLIFIGTDKLFNMILPFVAKKDLVIGYIPLTNKQSLANTLGITGPLEACEILAARRIIQVDLALANDNAFLTDCSIKSSHCVIDVGDNINLEVKTDNDIKLTNLPSTKPESSFLPNQQLLELTIITKNKASLFKKSELSISHFQDSIFKINADGSEGQLDSVTPLTLPAYIRILPQALNIIVGKDRAF